MTTCRIRVTRDTPVSGALEWMTISKQGEMLASGSTNLAQPAVAGPCEVILASDLVSLERVAVPPSQQRRLGSALRYLVEELALPDPERLHVAAAPAPERGVLYLGIVDRQWLRSLLDKLAGAKLSATGAYPETLLPTLLPHTWTVVWLGGEGFVRTGENEAVALDAPQGDGAPSNLRLALEQARVAGTQPHALVVRCCRNAAPPDLEAWSSALGVSVEPGPEWNWSDAQHRPPLDLLQGEFAARSGAPPWLRRLQRPAILAATLLALGSIALALDWWAKVRERDALLAEMHAVYRETFGERAVVVDAPLQMGRALADLRQRAGHVGPGDFPALLGVAADLLPGGSRLVEALAYDGATLTVTLRPGAAQQAGGLLKESRGKLPPGYELTQQESPAGGGVTLRLRPRTTQ
ncbi:MAG TPA: type II secretion system protein GspL [Burkholderiales bacterium]|nr:type II secretion system protein GspL [Burkholderiales bacterium]